MLVARNKEPISHSNRINMTIFRQYFYNFLTKILSIDGIINKKLEFQLFKVLQSSYKRGEFQLKIFF